MSVQGKIFLGGLDNSTTKETLLQYCQEWGEVTDHVLMEGRGFGFVTYADPANATQFLEVIRTSYCLIECLLVAFNPCVWRAALTRLAYLLITAGFLIGFLG